MNSGAGRGVEALVIGITLAVFLTSEGEVTRWHSKRFLAILKAGKQHLNLQTDSNDSLCRIYNMYWNWNLENDATSRNADKTPTFPKWSAPCTSCSFIPFRLTTAPQHCKKPFVVSNSSIEIGPIFSLDQPRFLRFSTATVFKKIIHRNRQHPTSGLHHVHPQAAHPGWQELVRHWPGGK